MLLTELTVVSDLIPHARILELKINIKAQMARAEVQALTSFKMTESLVGGLGQLAVTIATATERMTRCNMMAITIGNDQRSARG